jgi:PHD/YefM family antitoxin component YafN of YafNO toxin-antitoxin module
MKVEEFNYELPKELIAQTPYDKRDEARLMVLDKENNTYTIPVKNVITKEGQIDMQLVITEGSDEEEIPVFKSNKFYLFCNSSINAVNEAPDGYKLWIEQANVKLNEIDNLDIDIEDNVVTITKKDGTVKSENVKGDGYIITEEDYNEIETNVKSDIQPIIENIENISKQAEVIARGRATGYVFETIADLDEWLLNEENASKLTLGDNFYIVATNVPDYWWDGTQKRVLETEKPDLTEYAKKEQFVTLAQEEYDALETKSANTYYFIPEQEE